MNVHKERNGGTPYGLGLRMKKLKETGNGLLMKMSIIPIGFQENPRILGLVRIIQKCLVMVCGTTLPMKPIIMSVNGEVVIMKVPIYLYFFYSGESFYFLQF
jgi:hypothetical protein